ncbi:TPA: hypothetical protein DDW69_00760 [candidate division CPR2 bacterium]|uniref:TrkA-N domain protein n=1 Tax=candidate division CPR2 bacterium GW2011_GWC1_41_48 TaxID=1618344 RepID=A0A0G0W7B1_UNCC2|nr:MAG: TrkA-N domain protein [candidate division CPR2 bacterium GW2011_GWC2_39_35]KKS08870.1 MAG: TrkA-N domain protein [candidate division CPR2 bacterium GW2011_GWC1_41_48]HBG81355.1 hypothetical protein [candidate division CPR2 bacterium]HCL99670.1 hypothetical protein [candidate division CPR2 bacterium]
MRKEEKRNLKLVLLLFIFLLLGGTIGFVYFRGMDVPSAFYQTLIVLLTHFFHEVNEPWSVRILILILMVGSLIMIAYLFKVFAQYIFEGTLGDNIRRRRMKKDIEELKDHYIVCGCGRVGQQIVHELNNEGVEFIVVDRNEKVFENKIAKGAMYIAKDPTFEDNLREAGIYSAKCLIAALGEDTDNLLLTLAARSLNPKLYIVARCNLDENTSKMEKAGADRVAMPYQIGGYHMATMAMRPAVVDFLDVIIDSKHDELQVEEVKVDEDSPLVGHKLTEYLSRKKTGVTVLAINRFDGTSVVNPSGDQVVYSKDKLIIMGTKKQLEEITNSIFSEESFVAK